MTPTLDRRTLLTAAGAAGVVGTGTGLGLALGTGASSAAGPPPAALDSVAGRHPLTPGAPAAPTTAGTTLHSAAAAHGGGPYRVLTPGPGWRRVVRDDLAHGRRGREARRTVLASFVQFTDLHLVDVQHPLRYEYLRGHSAGAWRPQEALTVPATVALIERVNALRGGPVTGAALSFVMTTGDNTA